MLSGSPPRGHGRVFDGVGTRFLRWVPGWLV